VTHQKVKNLGFAHGAARGRKFKIPKQTMKIYVAGKKLERARVVMNMLRKHGHKITYDWANPYSEENSKEKAVEEREAIRNADLLVYLWEQDQESARYEAGMAMGLGKPIIVSGGPDAFFFKPPNIFRVDSDDEIVSAIKNV